MSRFSFGDIATFSDCRMKYDNIRPFRGRKEYGHARSLSRKDRRPNRITIRPLYKDKNGVTKDCFKDGEATGFACKLYNTDIVTYWNDGRIVIDTWASRITEDFAKACLPTTFHAWFTAPSPLIGVKLQKLPEGFKPAPSWREPRRYWQVSNSMTFIPTNNPYVLYEPAPEQRIDRFDNYRDNGKATTRELKQTRYHEFKDWLVVMAGLGGKMPDRPTTYSRISDWRGFLEAGHAAWVTLINNRHYIYGQHEHVPFMPYGKQRERVGTLKVGAILSACVNDIMFCVPDRVVVESYDYVDGLDKAYRVVKSYGRSRK